MAETTVPSINLLPKKGESFLTQFLNWTLTIGRLLIIIVEFVALGTFIYRFDLDMKIVDLKDKIEAQSFIVANFQKSEANFRDIQDRLELIKRYDEIGNTTTSTFADITKLGEGKVTFKDLTVEPENAKIEAQAGSPAAVMAFIDALKKHPAITGVIVDKVQNSASTSLVSVSITATLKPQAFDKDEPINPNAGQAVPILETE